MVRHGLVFPGQGVPDAGRGRDQYRGCRTARAVCDESGEAPGVDIAAAPCPEALQAVPDQAVHGKITVLTPAQAVLRARRVGQEPLIPWPGKVPGHLPRAVRQAPSVCETFFPSFSAAPTLVRKPFPRAMGRRRPLPVQHWKVVCPVAAAAEREGITGEGRCRHRAFGRPVMLGMDPPAWAGVL